jgi:NAD-dependent DNA ligase
MIGYDNISPVSPMLPVRPVRLSTTKQFHRKIQDFLVLQGKALQIMTYPLVGPELLQKAMWPNANEKLILVNALSQEQDRMRPSLIPSVIESTSQNQKHYDEFTFFELGRSYLDFEKEKLRIAQAEWDERYKAAEIERKNRIHETARSIPNLILEHELIEEEHDILVSGRKFLFTGKMVTGPRSGARKEIQKRGGITPTSNHLGDDIDYLVLGEDPEAGWLQLLHGGKLTSAFIKKFKNPSSRLHIIREDLLRAALMEAV